MPTREEINKMSHREKIQAELESAKEFGITPKRVIHLDPELKSERLTPIQFSEGSTIPPTEDEARINDHDFKSIITEFETVPDYIRPILFKDSAEALKYNIESDLDKLEKRNKQYLLPRIVAQLRDLQIQTGDQKKFQKIQQRISEAIFGTGEFRDIKGEDGGAIAPDKE